MFTLLAFLANTTGTPKCWAATQAMPMPEASMVRILLMGAPANRRFHSAPMALNRATSIWWFKKASTFKTPPGFTTPSLRMRCSSNSISCTLPWRRARCALPGRNFLYSTTCCHIGTSIWAYNTLHNAANRRGLHKMLSQEKGRSPHRHTHFPKRAAAGAKANRAAAA